MTESFMAHQRRNPIPDDTAQWTVLIVDDEPDNRVIAETVLSFSSVKVHCATQGEEGIKLLETLSPTFVLLDLSMPVMDGWEMLKLVRENPKTRPIPVIALTAHAMAGDREKVMDAGFDGYIAKPFRLGSFLSELNQCFVEIVERAQAKAGT